MITKNNIVRECKGCGRPLHLIGLATTTRYHSKCRSLSSSHKLYVSRDKMLMAGADVFEQARQKVMRDLV